MKKFYLYLSSFAPLYFLIIVKILINIIFGDLHFNILNSITLIILLIAIIVGIAGTFGVINEKKEGNTNIIIKSKQSQTEKYFLGYFSLFVLFALTFELEKVSMFVVFILISIMIGIVYIKNDLLYINPFLNLIGYNFYELTFIENGTGKEVTKKFLCKGEVKVDGKLVKAKLSDDNFSLILKN